MDKCQIFTDARDIVCRRERENRVDRAAAETEIDKLRPARGRRDRGKPDYDVSGAPVVYAERYQLSQMNLCYSLFRSSAEMPDRCSLEGIIPSIPQGSEIRILDFGCGTMALQWAVAWVVDELIKKNISVPNVKVFCSDSSRRMIETGKRLWRELDECVRSEGDESMQNAMKKVSNSVICKKEIDPKLGFNLITGIHLVSFEKYRDELDNFSQVVYQCNPEYAILTTTKGNEKHRFIENKEINGYKAKNVEPESLRQLMLGYGDMDKHSGWSPYEPFARLYHRES